MNRCAFLQSSPAAVTALACVSAPRRAADRTSDIAHTDRLWRQTSDGPRAQDMVLISLATPMAASAQERRRGDYHFPLWHRWPIVRRGLPCDRRLDLHILKLQSPAILS